MSWSLVPVIEAIAIGHTPVRNINTHYNAYFIDPGIRAEPTRDTYAPFDSKAIKAFILNRLQVLTPELSAE